jgi:hypothetical protein
VRVHIILGAGLPCSDCLPFKLPQNHETKTYLSRYRHETWAALRTGRQMSLNETYWEPAPIDSYEHLRPHDIANRVIFIFGQCVNFCNNDCVSRCQTVEKWNDERVAKAESLEYALSAWKSKLPACMTCYSSESTSVRAGDPSNPFGSTWYIFPQSGTYWPSP